MRTHVAHDGLTRAAVEIAFAVLDILSHCLDPEAT